MTRRRIRALVFVLIAQSAWAQTGSPSLRGQITDPSGASVPSAAVTVLQSTAVIATAQTDTQGRFQIADLKPGRYTIRIVAQGFAVAEANAYEIAAGRSQIFNVRLKLGVESETITVAESSQVELDPAANAGALVLRGRDLDALGDNREDLIADLQALAGPAAGPNGGEIFIDGFTGGRLPPKSSILEVRINQNPFAAQFDRPGFGRIEIITKPGEREFHGELQFRFSDDAFNSRNPFSPIKPPFQRRQWEGNVTGPLGRKTSFFLDFERKDVSENAFVNATTLDQNLAIVPLTQAIVVPATGVEVNLKVDHQFSKNHTLSARYGLGRDLDENQGVGGFSLASRAYRVRDNEDTWQASETAILNVRTVNEIRFRYRRQRTSEIGGSAAPTISVLDAFTSGGAALLDSFNHQDRYELQNFTSLVHGVHLFRWGGRWRGVAETDQATRNYAGTYTFSSLAGYRQTLLDQQRGLTGAQIRAAGDGPSQFSIMGGNPRISIHQFDLGFFAQDDWRVRQNLTLSLGVRYETQNHIHDWTDFAPRFSLAWGIGKMTSRTPKTVLRTGFGIFYDRFGEGFTLEAQRLDGIRQQQFVIPFPDFFPLIPPLTTLTANRLPQAIRRIDPSLRAPALYQAAVTLERQLTKNIVASTTYTHTRGVHSLRSRNLNAPFADGGFPVAGGNSTYSYESSGRFRQQQLVTNLSVKAGSRLTLTSFYAWNRARSDADGAGTFPANPYDLSSEYGRAGFDVRHRFVANGSLAAPWGLRLSPFLVVSSGRPFNITLGRDLNNDTLFTDRPAFATDLNRASVVRTPFGTLDTAPLPAQKLIPRNLGNGPMQVSADLRASKTFTIGEQAKGAQKKKGRDPVELTLTVAARNVLNHPNLGSPVGNLSSLFFGRSTSLAGGGGGAAGNRRLDLQAKISF